MRLKTTNASAGNFSNLDQESPKFSCQYTRDFTSYLNDTVALQSTVVVASITCPAAILFNGLVVIAVRQKQELQRNSNILLCSLGKADLLIGASSMPLNVVLGVIVLQQVQVENFCTLFLVTALVLEVACAYSLYLLTVIAWERYIAITKCIEYRATVTRSRIERNARIAWFITILTGTVQFFVLETPGLDFTFPDILPITIFCLPSSICLAFMVYFCVKILLEVCQRKLERISQVSAYFKVKQDRKVAVTTASLTLVVLSSYAPSIIIRVLGYRNSILRQSKFFLWTQVLIELNSLANPLIYCFRNRHFMNAVLELLKMKQPDATQKAVAGRLISYKTNTTYKLVQIKIQHAQVSSLHVERNFNKKKWKSPRRCSEREYQRVSRSDQRQSIPPKRPEDRNTHCYHAHSPRSSQFRVDCTK